MRVVFAGDSITASAECQTWLPGAEVVNVAVPGFTTDDLIHQLPRIIELAPNVLVLLIGTNDLGGLDRDPDDVADDIVAIVHRLLDELPATRIVLNAILPRDPFWTPAITRINTPLAALGSHEYVTYVDTWTALATGDRSGLDPRYLLDDGFDVHINDEGYRAWRSLLTPVISV